MEVIISFFVVCPGRYRGDPFRLNIVKYGGPRPEVIKETEIFMPAKGIINLINAGAYVQFQSEYVFEHFFYDAKGMDPYDKTRETENERRELGNRFNVGFPPENVKKWMTY